MPALLANSQRPARSILFGEATGRQKANMKPQAVDQYSRTLQINDDGTKVQVVQCIQRIHDRVQPAFVNKGAPADALLKRCNAQKMLRKQMSADFKMLPIQVQQQPKEGAISGLYDLYRALRCAFPGQWGLSEAKPRRSRAARAQVPTPAAPAAISATAPATSNVNPDEATEVPAAGSEFLDVPASFVRQLLQETLVRHEGRIEAMEANMTVLIHRVTQLEDQIRRAGAAPAPPLQHQCWGTGRQSPSGDRLPLIGP
ncbi:uncharacterized protein N7515_009073 [Penicillium bovifimosum]|uniref:Uncharacterized protein n=1 Tax=Penicillium bovifimosum TaxID=126998 RepID=A0A9W9GIK3_9EURO|nr:uncharacterized protein N7515_009073 [Penicillium bovifimosum]KAJ5121112.1 hypothetical protein N7515_009073 [Penicillium bovifimosum]